MKRQLTKLVLVFIESLETKTKVNSGYICNYHINIGSLVVVPHCLFFSSVYLLEAKKVYLHRASLLALNTTNQKM